MVFFFEFSEGYQKSKKAKKQPTKSKQQTVQRTKNKKTKKQPTKKRKRMENIKSFIFLIS